MSNECKAGFANDTNRVRKRVKYINDSGSDKTIYEGEPLCYVYDSTTNLTGWSRSSAAESYTTAEGYQNEGKYMTVQNPETNNLGFFAGVVAPGSWVGKVVEGNSYDGELWLEIYVPNGAIVPVRSYISSTVGTSALAIMNGTQYLGKPNAGMTNGAARYVAIAEETVDRSSTAGLCLARLDPNMFLWQCGASAKLDCATAGTTVDVAANFINVSSAQTSGGFTGLWVRSETATAANSDTSLAIYGEANITGVAAASPVAVRASLNIWGGTQTAGLIYALYAEIYEEGANLTGGSVIAPLVLRTQIDATNPPAANCHWMIYTRVDGADKPDGLLYAVTADAIKLATQSSASVSHTIPIRVAGTTYYIMVSSAA